MAIGLMDRAAPVPSALLEQVAACAAGIASPRALPAEVAEHRAGGQRVVLEYRFDDGLSIFAKRYPRAGNADETLVILRSLWDDGFGPGSPVGVPEPLGSFPEWGVILTRRVPGECLYELRDRPSDWGSGLAAAGTWLGRLHSARVSLGPVEATTDAVFRLARVAAGAAARHPELEQLSVRLIKRLARRARKVRGSAPRVQTHGRYHLRHVFVSPSRVTAIDLDRAALADPAKDLGEFLHNLFVATSRRGDPLPEGWASRFVQAYLEVTGVLPPGVGYWWSYSTLSRLLRTVQNDRERWERRLESYGREFEMVPELVETLDPGT